MLISSTRPVDAIIQAVSPESILAACAAVCANAGVMVAAHEAAMPKAAPTCADKVLVMFPPSQFYSECVVIGFPGSDAHGAAQVIDKDFPVADLSGLGGGADRCHHLVFEAILDGDFDLQLWQEIHRVFSAAIDLGVALLAPKA